MAKDGKEKLYPKVVRFSGEKEKFLDFERQIGVEIDKIGGRARSVWSGTEEDVTAANLQDYATETMNGLYVTDPSKAKTLYDTWGHFATIPMQKLWHGKVRKEIFTLLYSTTEGDAHETVQEYGEERIHELRAKFVTCYGKTELKDMQQLISLYEAGKVRPDGKVMQPSDDPVKFFVRIRKMRAALRQNIPHLTRWDDDSLVKIIIDVVPECYTVCIETMKQNFCAD